MKSRCNSAVEMKQVFTPRVKDGRFSNDSPQKHYYGRTAPRLSQSNDHFHNPQYSPQKAKMAKVPQKDVQNVINMKLDLNNQQASSPQISKKLNVKGPNQPNKTNKQQTINGRVLQYPANGKISNINQRQKLQNHQSIELMKSSSLSSKHFADRSIKSASIKSKKEEFEEKFKVTFGYLLDQNQEYLKERRRACIQKARPKDQIFKILRPTITTTNRDQFPQKDTPYDQYIQPQNLKTANSFGPRKVCGNSTTNQFHNGRQGPRADLAQWPEGFKLQGPIYQATTYGNHFPNHGEYQKMVPVAKFNQHPLGFAHKTNSTNRTFHKGEFTEAAKLATWNNLHPYGNGFDPNRGTTYGNNHNSKQPQPIQQWPMYDPQLIKSDGKFTTQYKSNLVDNMNHELNYPNYCDCGRKSHKH